MTNPTERELTDKLADALEELFAMVKGECPSLLNEDSGGDAKLCIAIEEVLSAYRAQRDGERGYRALTEDDVIQAGDEYHFTFSEWKPFTSMVGQRYEVGHWPSRRPLAKGEA